MWWEPRNANEALLAAALAQLGNWFKDEKSSNLPIAWGYGAIWSKRYSALVPLVLVSRERGFRSSVSSEFDSFATPLELFGPELAALLPRLESKLPLYALPVSRPRPSSVADAIINEFIPIRHSIVCVETGELGTAGIPVCTDPGRYGGLLTAGHVFPRGAGSRVMQVHRRLLLRRTESLGRVVAHVAPNGSTPSWDAAVITLDKPFHVRAPLVRRTLDAFKAPESIVVHGAISGSPTDAGVQGSLEEVSNKEVSWLNCWLTGPSGILTNGDSGAAVFTRNRKELLGMYVGSSEFTASGKPFFHYVQDAHSLEVNVLRKWGVRYREDEQ